MMRPFNENRTRRRLVLFQKCVVHRHASLHKNFEGGHATDAGRRRGGGSLRGKEHTFCRTCIYSAMAWTRLIEQDLLCLFSFRRHACMRVTWKYINTYAQQHLSSRLVERQNENMFFVFSYALFFFLFLLSPLFSHLLASTRPRAPTPPPPRCAVVVCRHEIVISCFWRWGATSRRSTLSSSPRG